MEDNNKEVKEGTTPAVVEQVFPEPTGDIMEYFPLESPRKTQERVLREIDRVFKTGKRIIILRAPVGSGKSAIALTLARYFTSAHILTPRKSLQDQYAEDFPEVAIMKGRNSYPCTVHENKAARKRVNDAIANGNLTTLTPWGTSCAMGPCKGDEEMWKQCTSIAKCPYSVAISVATKTDIVVHNVHSFIFQTNFAGRFDKRSLMIVDEAHDLESIIREFITKKFTVNKEVKDEDTMDLRTLNDWCDFFLKDEYVPKETEADKANKEADANYESAKDSYISRVEKLRENAERYGEEFSVSKTPREIGGKVVTSVFQFTPSSLGNSVNNLILDYGNKVILMSGTIYDHKQYCLGIGINPNDAISIEIPSSFPAVNRPVYMKPEYQTDTSHAMWEENFDDMVKIIDRIQNIFKDVKGLIHVPSYNAGYQLKEAIPGNRIMFHDKNNFNEVLQAFYDTKSPKILISPVCQQGVDFKDDRARFQIITRVPYLNAGDPFVEYKINKDFNWYNYQALVILGQMLGRPVRNERDFGATFLLDSRFNKFISRNMRRLPKWVQDSFIYR